MTLILIMEGDWFCPKWGETDRPRLKGEHKLPMSYDILQLKILLIFTVRDRSKLSLIILVSHNRMTQPENRPSLNTGERLILPQTQGDPYTLTKKRVWVPTMTGTRTQRPQILERMAMGYEPIGDFEVMFKPEKSRT